MYVYMYPIVSCFESGDHNIIDLQVFAWLFIEFKWPFSVFNLTLTSATAPLQSK